MRNKAQADWSASDIFNEILTCEKNMTSLYNSAVNESSDNSIHRDFMNILTDAHQMQRNVFTVMERRGLYQTQTAENQEIAEAGQKYNQFKQDFQ